MSTKVSEKKWILDLAKAMMESGEASPAKARETAARMSEKMMEGLAAGESPWVVGAKLLRAEDMPGTAEEWEIKGASAGAKTSKAKEGVKISWSRESHEKIERNWVSEWLDRLIKDAGGEVNTEKLAGELERESVWKGGSWEQVARAAGRAVLNAADGAAWTARFAGSVELEAWLRESLGVSPAKEGWDAVNKRLREDCFKRVEKERKGGRLSPRFPDRKVWLEVMKRIDGRRDAVFSVRWLTAFRDGMKGLWDSGDEFPCQAFARAALALGGEENEELQTEKAKDFFSHLASGKILLPIKTLRTAGFYWQVWCSDWSLKPDDSVESLFDASMRMASLTKDGRSVSIGMDAVRAKGTAIRASGKKAAGVPGFMDLFEAAAKTVGGQGMRVFLSPWHMDFQDFLERSEKGGKTLRTGVLLPDAFMRAVERDSEWVMFSTAETPRLGDSQGEDLTRWLDQYSKMFRAGAISGKTIKAKALFRRLCETIAATGDPAIVFTGILGSMLPNATGVPDSRLRLSVPVEKGEGGGFSEAALDVRAPQAVWDAVVRMCDNALSADETSRKSGAVSKWRPIAITPMNLFGGSEEDEESVWRLVAEKARSASLRLGEEKGASPGVKESLWIKSNPWLAAEQEAKKGRDGGSSDFARLLPESGQSGEQRNALLLGPSSREDFSWAMEWTPGAFPRTGRDEIRWQGRKWTIKLGGAKRWKARENLDWAGRVQGGIDQGQTLDLWMEGRTPEMVWETLFRAWLLGVPSIRRLVQDRRI